jgi:hypothetical protein
MFTLVRIRENVDTWIGFAGLAKGPVLPMKNRNKLYNQLNQFYSNETFDT